MLCALFQYLHRVYRGKPKLKIVLVVALEPIGRYGVKTLKAGTNTIATRGNVDAHCVRKIIRAACRDDNSAIHRDGTLDDLVEIVSIEYRRPVQDGDSNGHLNIPTCADSYSAWSNRQKAFDSIVSPSVREVAIDIFVLNVELMVIGK